MGDDEETTTYNKKPFFNMAEASLKRIDAVLLQIGMVSASILPDLVKQKKKITLVRTLLQYATPLNPEIEKEYKEEIFKYKIKTKSIINGGIQKSVEVFDQKLNDDIDEMVIKIGLKLKGYFMPEVPEEDEDEY
jgi:predicted RND superfamily exporter protein